MLTNLYFILIVLFFSLGITTPTSAFDVGTFFQRFGEDHQKKSSLNLTVSGNHLPLQTHINGFVSSLNLNPMIKLDSTAFRSNFNLMTGTEITNVRFSVNDVSLCKGQLKASKTATGNALILGFYPEIDINSPIPDDSWPDIALAKQTLVDHLRNEMEVDTLKLVAAAPCFFVDNFQLNKSFAFETLINGYPYQIIASDYQVYGLEKRYFDAAGSALIFEDNAKDGSLKEFQIDDFVGDGTLETKYLKSVPNGTEAAQDDDHLFEYDPSDIRFEEVSAFFHAQLHFDFFVSLGFNWYGPKPLNIKIHEKPHGQTNNALFVPANGSSVLFPTISIGDGDGKALQNLPRDSDVVSHEFGHHVIYKTLKSTANESLVLHEGLADFFAFSRTGDGCLGETICPTGSSACWVESKCLRTADNDLNYGDDDFTGLQGHHKGQIISGLLWDIRKADSIPANDLTQIVFKSLDFLLDTSDIRDFLLSLFLADEELFDGKYRDTLLDASDVRGFASLVDDVGKTLPKPSGSSKQQASSTKSGGESSKSSSDTGIKCGSIAQSGTSNFMFGVLMLFLFPIAIYYWEPKKVKIKISQKDRLNQK